MLPDYQWKIAKHYNIPIGNVKKLVPNYFDKEIYETHYVKLKLYLRLGLKRKKIHPALQFNQSQCLKQYVGFNEKNGEKDGKELYKLINNFLYGKAMEDLRNRINFRLERTKKDYLNENPNQAKCQTKYLTMT